MSNTESHKPIVYFLCTGNSCRSQIAEGWARALGKDKIDVYSAGIEAHGLNPRAVTTMKERNIDISHHTSKEIDRDLLNRADYAITLCGDAKDRCPTTPPHVKRMHWGFEDPAQATGSEEEIQEKFREVREGIYLRVDEFLRSIGE